MQSLSEFKITLINFSFSTQSGLVNGGNEILATSTFVQNGVTNEVPAVRFIANPVGKTSTTNSARMIVLAEEGQSTYVSCVTTDETIDVVQKGVAYTYGNRGPIRFSEMLISTGSLVALVLAASVPVRAT